MRSFCKFLLRVMRFLLGWLLLLGASAWAFGALRYDFPIALLRWPVAILFVGAALFSLLRVKPRWYAKLGLCAAIALVMAGWFSLQPSNDRPWQPDVAQTAWAEKNGDEIILHNLRNCDYRTENEYTPHWETRTVKLSQLTGIDIALNYWGSEWMAHPILSFQFSDGPPVALSIETRKEVGESYSAIGGLYRQFELIYIAADERDVLRLRANYRQGEDLYLYRTTLTPAEARERFLEYVDSMNEMRDHPRWYNATTTNCTTAIRSQHTQTKRTPWDWRILLNGKIDKLFFDQGIIATDGLPFTELKQRALINAAAQAANDSPDFSKLIRAGRPGFGG